MKETDIQRTICDYLALKKHVFFRLNNTPIYDPVRKAFRAMPKYTPKGIADILCFDKTGTGIAIFLEVKTDKGKQSPDQKLFADTVTKTGAEYHVVRSLGDVMELGL